MAFLWRSTRQADDQLRRAEGSSSPGGPSEGGHHATGALAAAHLRRGGVTEVVVLNRSRERARRLADNVRGTGIRPAPPRSRTSWPWRTCW